MSDRKIIHRIGEFIKKIKNLQLSIYIVLIFWMLCETCDSIENLYVYLSAHMFYLYSCLYVYKIVRYGFYK